MFELTLDRCVVLLALMLVVTLLSLAALFCQVFPRRRVRRDRKELKRSLINLRARDQGASILSTLIKP